MPRSVNTVAAKARRKKIIKAAKGYFGRRKNVHTVAKIMTANELKRDYRVFAIPRHLHSKKAVDDAFKPIIKSVKDSLPKKAALIFGTDAEWRDFMEFNKIKSENWNQKWDIFCCEECIPEPRPRLQQKEMRNE